MTDARRSATVVTLLLAAGGLLGLGAADPLWTPLIIAGMLGIFVLMMVNTDAAIVLLILSMLLSPEMSAGAVPSRQVVLRFDDIILATVLFSWLAKTALRQELGLLRWTELHGPLLLLTAWFLVATALGIVNGEVRAPKESLFYLLKYFEYFVVFFLGVNVIRERRQVDLFWRALACTALVVGLYGWWQHHAGAARVSAPFEGEHGEPNTLAGYLVLLMGVMLGRAACAATMRRFLFGLLPALFLFMPLMNTLSRGGYLAFLTMYAALIALSPRRRAWLIVPAIVIAVTGVTIFPQTVIERVMSTFVERSPYGTVGEQMGLDLSAAQRIDVWFWTFDLLKKHPLVGYGITGAGLMDHQYCLVLGETGLIGGGLYLWTRWLILRSSWRAYRQVQEPEYRGLILGYICAFIGLLVHSLAGNIFIIVRIMEPFWFLTALVLMLPRVLADAPAPQPASAT